MGPEVWRHTEWHPPRSLQKPILILNETFIKRRSGTRNNRRFADSMFNVVDSHEGALTATPVIHSV